MHDTVKVANRAVGPSPRPLSWTLDRPGGQGPIQAATALRGSTKLLVVRDTPARGYRLRVGGHYLPHLFCGIRAAQRYAEGAVLDLGVCDIHADNHDALAAQSE